MIRTQRLPELIDFLSSPRQIVITTHHKPDGDAMGSSLGLYNALIQLGHRVQVVTPNDYGSFLHWLPGNETVIEFERSSNAALLALKAAELVFCLDFNDLKRVNELGTLISELGLPTVMIDHHLNPPGFETYTFHNTEASSTCELIFDFLDAIGQKQTIDAQVAACLYTGIMTDTGSFKFPATTPKVHRLVAELMERGANHTFIHQAVFDQMSENVLRFLGHCFSHKLQVLPAHKTAYFSVSAGELEQFELQTGDTEGLVNYALNIRGIRFAALIIDRTKLVKMSFRSKGDIPANEFAATWFDGGGHFNAAGGQSNDSLEQTEARFLQALELFAPKILGAK
jgi:phosphoesterase RecJ-like protein